MTRGLALVACALLACSALDLDEFAVRPCAVPGEPPLCEQLNAELPANACMLYRCDESGVGCELAPRDDDGDHVPDELTCAGELDVDLDCDDGDPLRHEGLAETWDNQDNDCDGAIDEAADPVLPPRTTLAPRQDGRLVRLAHSELVDGELFGVLTYAVDDRSETVDFRWAADDDLRAAPVTSQEICKFGEASSRCKFAESALSAGRDGLLIGGAVNRAGCSSGQLHVGVGVASADAFHLSLGVAPAASNVGMGVDIEGTCTLSAGERQGVTALAVAMLPSDRARAPQALLVWLAEGRSDEELALVSALGLVVSETGSEAVVNGTFGGHSEALGRGQAIPPRIIGLRSGDRTGYVVAYGAVDEVQMVFVPAFEDTQSSMRSERALQGALPAKGVLQVALAAEGPTGAGLGLAWRSGDRVLFAPVAFDDKAEAPFSIDEPRVLRDGGATIVEGPVVAYAPAGFNSADLGLGASAGGWFVAWLEQTGATRRAIGARIATDDATVLGEPFELARGDISQLFTVAGPAPGGETCIVYGFVEGRRLEVGQLHCATSITPSKETPKDEPS